MTSYEEFYALPNAQQELFWHIIRNTIRFDTMNEKLAFVGFEVRLKDSL